MGGTRFLILVAACAGCVTVGAPPPPGPRPAPFPPGTFLAREGVVLCETAVLSLPRRHEGEFSLSALRNAPRRVSGEVVELEGEGDARAIFRSGFRIDAAGRLTIRLLTGDAPPRLVAQGEVTWIRVDEGRVTRGMKTLTLEGTEVRFTGEAGEAPVDAGPEGPGGAGTGP